MALQATQVLDEAASHYAAALRLDPGHAAAANNLGLIHAARGRFDAAADHYLHALDANPGYAPAAYNLGRALRGQRRDAEAGDAFCLALRLDRDLEDARRELAALGRDAAACRR